MREKRLLIVLGSMGRGGAERVISHISNYFATQGWKVWIVLLLFNKVEYDLHDNVQVIDLSGTGQSRIKRLPYWMIKLRKLVREVRPDAILSFAARINIIVQLTCVGIKTRMIVSERNDPFLDGRSKWIDMLTDRLYPKATAVVFQTRRAMSYFNHLDLQNAVVIPNPIAVSCKATQANENKIVTVGRLTAQKNQKMLIDAFCEVRKEFPFAELHVFGEGELRAELQERIDRLNLTECVYLRGNVSDIHQQIADASVFVLSSDYEGLSNALLEAMMVGLPCVSTDCAGSDEYIENNKNGLLTEVGNKEEMYRAMCWMLENKEMARTMGREAENVSLRVEKDIIMKQWYHVITGTGENI